MSNALYHIMSVGKRQLNNSIYITTYNKPFKSRQPKWEYDSSGQIAVMLIGLAVAGMAGNFAIEVVHLREV